MSISLLLLLLAPPQQPSTIVVDWDQNAPWAFQTITAALASGTIQSGDTILVRGLIRNGYPAAYAEFSPDPSPASMETFPLAIPEGVTLKADPNSPALYIWTDGTSFPGALIQLENTEVGSPLTTIADLALGGGPIGIEVRPDPLVDGSFHGLVNSVTFSGNTRGLVVEADTGMQIDFEVEHCNLQHQNFNPALLVNPPVLEIPSVGLSFAGTDTGLGGPGIVNAEVLDLSLIGATQPTDEVAWLTQDHDLALAPTSIMAASRIIEVFALGDSQNHEHQSGGTFGIPIASVNLQVLGSILDGKNSLENLGWDIGVYAAAQAGGSDTFFGDYCAGYEILISGSTIKNCRIEGVYGTSLNDTRGRIEIVNSLISDIGHSGGVGISGNGIHMSCLEGYLALICSEVQSTNNLRCGSLVHCFGTYLGKANWPLGLLLRLESCRFDNNSLHGIEIAGPSSGFVTVGQGGIVGGTWDQAKSGNRSLIEDNGKKFGNFDYGPGYINRCEIFENSENGIHVVLGKRAGADGSIAHVRLANSFIWDNGKEGFCGESVTPDDDVGMKFLTPITHCTIAHNGGSGFPSLAYKGINQTNVSFFRYAEPLGEDPINRILNSIFERSNSSHEDFSAATRDLCVDDHPFNIPGSNKIGVRGIRAKWNVIGGPPIPPFDTSTDKSTPFAGYTSPFVGVEWFYLDSDPAAPNYLDFVDETPTSYSLIETLSNLDFIFSPRPSGASGLRDKGAHEVSP